MSSKNQEKITAVIESLTALGWEAEGVTREETVRVGTAKAPVLGGIGGELRTFGGRQRFRKPETLWHVTIGARTTNFYRLGDKGTTNFQQFKSSEIEQIQEFAQLCWK